MNVTKDGFKDRQLHIEDYLQMVSAEQKEYAEVSAHQRIAENNDIITDFQTDKLMECQTAHCGRYIPHFDFGAKPSPIVPYRHLPQTLSGMTADCRSLV